MDRQFKQYFDEVPCCASIHDRDLIIIDGNNRFREIFGNRIGEPCYRVYMGRDEICDDCPVKMTFEDGQSRISQRTLLNRSGGETHALVHIAPIRDERGEVEAVMEMHTDFGVVKELQQKLETSRGRLARLFDIVPCYLSIQGPDLVIQDANRAFTDVFGPAIGKSCYRVFKGRETPCQICPAVATFEDGKTREHEEVLTTSDKGRIDVLCTTAPIHDREGNVVAVLEMATDISQVRRLSAKLTSIGLLVASLSHRIKGHLTGLDGGLYLVNSGFSRGDSDRVERGWKMVERNVSHIRATVLDILHHAKDRDLDLGEIDATELLEDVLALLSKRAGEVDVAVELDATREAVVFFGDREAIRAALINLVEYSLESCRADTDQRHHRLRASAHRADPWMEFRFEDDGPVPDDNARERLFTPSAASAEEPEPNLALFAASEVVKKHGGQIDLLPREGGGKLFRILLPIEPRPTTEPGEPPPPVEGIG